MFGIGMPELIVILAVALVVIGPKKLPDLAKSLGKALGEFKRATNDLKQSIEQESGLDEVRESLKETDRDIRRSFDASSATPSGPTASATSDAPEAILPQEPSTVSDTADAALPKGDPPGPDNDADTKESGTP